MIGSATAIEVRPGGHEHAWCADPALCAAGDQEGSLQGLEGGRLAGTGVEALARTARDGRPQRVFFVPATINYLVTLEAPTLIADFLQESGKARYIIEDDAQGADFASTLIFEPYV